MSALSAAAHATGTLDDAASANAVAEPLAARPVIRDVKIGKLPAASRDKDPSDSQLMKETAVSALFMVLFLTAVYKKRKKVRGEE